jgi:hypothetical protein
VSAIRNRLSYANVIATIAVFLALGGGAYALALERGEVKSKHIAKNAVKSKHVKDGKLQAKDVKDSDFLGDVVAREFVDADVDAGEFATTEIQCQSGETAVGAGASFTNGGADSYGATEVDSIVRNIAPLDSSGDAVDTGDEPTGYFLAAQSQGANQDFHAHVLCAG